jgi:hypothetical protein
MLHEIMRIAAQIAFILLGLHAPQVITAVSGEWEKCNGILKVAWIVSTAVLVVGMFCAYLLATQPHG